MSTQPSSHSLELESPFGSDELFFSTTDYKGIIRSGNEVFRRVSEYTFEELIGKPHSVIRHPDMPRAVFKLLWDYIEAKKTIVAFVKNQSKTGRYYWVIAYVKPVEGGYLSVRFKPSAEIISVIVPLYKAMRDAEIAAGDKGPTRKVGMERATTLLLEKLNDLGFSSYDDFMHSILVQELSIHCANLKMNKNITLEGESSNKLTNYLSESYDANTALQALIEQIKVLSDAEKNFAKITSTIGMLSDNVRLFAMNASVESIKLGELGRTVSILAQFLGSGSAQLKSKSGTLLGALDLLMPKVKRLMFNIAGAKLLIEMVVVFLQEQVSSSQETSHSTTSAYIKSLIEAFANIHLDVGVALQDVINTFPQILSIADEVSQGSRELSFVHVTGRIEAVQLPQGSSFGGILESMSSKILDAEEELILLKRICTQVKEGLNKCVPTLSAVDTYISHMNNFIR